MTFLDVMCHLHARNFFDVAALSFACVAYTFSSFRLDLGSRSRLQGGSVNPQFMCDLIRTLARALHPRHLFLLELRTRNSLVLYATDRYIRCSQFPISCALDVRRGVVMNKVYASQIHREWRAIGAAGGFVIVGFLVVWLARTMIQPLESSVLIALIVLPLVVYLSVSGKLAQFKAGGIEAKFAEIATESVSSASETISYNDLQVVAKEGVRGLMEKKEEIDESKPVVMTMITGGHAHYTVADVKHYLTILSQYRNFKFVVFLDSKERFVAYMPSWALKQLVDIKDLADEFINFVNEGRVAQMLRYPGVIEKAISTKSTNEDALRDMIEKNIEALVVIDGKRKLRGIVEREQVLSRMMLMLVH